MAKCGPKSGPKNCTCLLNCQFAATQEGSHRGGQETPPDLGGRPTPEEPVLHEAGLGRRHEEHGSQIPGQRPLSHLVSGLQRGVLEKDEEDVVKLSDVAQEADGEEGPPGGIAEGVRLGCFGRQ